MRHLPEACRTAIDLQCTGANLVWLDLTALRHRSPCTGEPKGFQQLQSKAEDYSTACSTTPVATADSYEGKGQWVTVDGLKACMLCSSDLAPAPTYASLDTAGSPIAKRGILFVYDIFGYAPQTIQGADILADESYFVVMPDFFQRNRRASSGILPTPMRRRRRCRHSSTRSLHRQKLLLK